MGEGGIDTPKSPVASQLSKLNTTDSSYVAHQDKAQE